MRELSIAASLFSAVVLAAVPGGAASAADLSGPPPAYDQGYEEGGDDSYASDEDRGPPPGGYAERYERREEGYEERYRAAPPPADEDDDDYADGPPAGSVKDGYPVPVPPPRYGDRGPGPGPDRYACLEPYQIEHRLHARGWIDIRPMGGQDGFVRVQARRPDSSSVFVLRVDRCSGEVAWSRPIRTFAYAPRPWHRWHRWDD